MDEATWDKIIQCGIEFAAEVCRVSITRFKGICRSTEIPTIGTLTKGVHHTDYTA